MMRMLLGLVRVGAVVLLGASAWYGFVAGTRRWGPCLDNSGSVECVEAQSHETAYLPELGIPEGISWLLLGGALLLLALLGRLPWGWRVAALTVGPLYALVGVDELRSVGQTEVPWGPAPEPTLLDGLFGLAHFSAPLVMVSVGVVLLARSAEASGSRWLHPDLPVGLAWVAMVVGCPVTEYIVLSMFYSSHDSPPGTGLLRSAMVALAAGLVVWHLASRTAYRDAPQTASTASRDLSPSAGATSEA